MKLGGSTEPHGRCCFFRGVSDPEIPAPLLGMKLMRADYGNNRYLMIGMTDHHGDGADNYTLSVSVVMKMMLM